MTAFSKNGGTGNDFDLGIEGFCFADLFDAVKLKELADRFYAEIGEHDGVLHSALTPVG